MEGGGIWGEGDEKGKILDESVWGDPKFPKEAIEAPSDPLENFAISRDSGHFCP